MAVADDGREALGDFLGDVGVNPVAFAYRRDGARFQGRPPQIDVHIDVIDTTASADRQRSFRWKSS